MTEIKAYFDSKMGYKKYRKPIIKYNEQETSNDELYLLYKEDLMNMGRTKIKKFIDNKQSPIKVIGQECYVINDKLQEWFCDFEGMKIDIN